jgi:hypothetical protein
MFGNTLLTMQVVYNKESSTNELLGSGKNGSSFLKEKIINKKRQLSTKNLNSNMEYNLETAMLLINSE